MPLRASASRSAFTYISVGLGTAASSLQGRGADRDLAADAEDLRPGDAFERDLGLGPRRRRRDAVVDGEAAAGRRRADDGARPGLLAGPDQQLDLVLVVLQRADRRAVAERDVVPRPARGPAGLGKGVVVADQLAGDQADAARRELLRPLVEHRPSLGVPRVDRRVAVRRHHQVAVDGAIGRHRPRWHRCEWCSGSPSQAARPRPRR